jgi:hypothetical protein
MRNALACRAERTGAVSASDRRYEVEAFAVAAEAAAIRVVPEPPKQPSQNAPSKSLTQKVCVREAELIHRVWRRR